MKRDLPTPIPAHVNRPARERRNFGSINNPEPERVSGWRPSDWHPLRTVLVRPDIQARIDAYRRYPSLKY